MYKNIIELILTYSIDKFSNGLNDLETDFKSNKTTKQDTMRAIVYLQVGGGVHVAG